VRWLLAPGYIYSLFVGQLFVGWFMHRVYRLMGGPGTHKAVRWQPAAVGYLERALYTTAWLYGVPEFIGLWFLVRAAGQWGRWQRGFKDATGREFSGRAVYNTFLLGAGLSLAFGVGGAVLAQGAADSLWVIVTLAAVLPIALCSLLALGPSKSEKFRWLFGRSELDPVSWTAKSDTERSCDETELSRPEVSTGRTPGPGCG
jgi:hypothetical protein